MLDSGRMFDDVAILYEVGAQLGFLCQPTASSSYPLLEPTQDFGSSSQQSVSSAAWWAQNGWPGVKGEHQTIR